LSYFYTFIEVYIIAIYNDNDNLIIVAKDDCIHDLALGRSQKILLAQVKYR